MNPKKLSVILILGIGLQGLKAQEAIPTSGGNASGSGGSASYSVGQVIYTTNAGINGSIAQGVQQPFEVFTVTGIERAKAITLQCTTYPNPVTDYLILKIEGELKVQFMASLYSMNGKLLGNTKINCNETSIVMKNSPPAIYFLKITEGNEEVKTFKIIKTN